MYCVNCGTQLPEGAKFCYICGKQLSDEKNDNLQNSTIQILINNCPSCGIPINSYTAVCPGCGREILRKVSSKACEDLCLKLEQIEQTRPKKKFWMTFFDDSEITETDQKKIDIINNYFIPNNKADIIDFIVLCKSKYDTCERMANDTNAEDRSLQKRYQEVWGGKLNEAYSKAEIVLKNDTEYLTLKQTYLSMKYRAEGVCQYCGGKFKGLFQKVCVKCGKPLDY